MRFCSIVLNALPRLRGILLDGVLRIHNFSYKVASRLAVYEGSGTHPKHRIIGYHQWFLDHIAPGSVVLDIGCGAGHLSRSLSTKASHVYAIDIVSWNIDVAMRTPHAENITYLCADATSMDLSCHVPDHIVLSNVLEHIRDRADFLSSLSTMLISGGTLLLRVPMVNRCWLPLYKRERGVEWRLDSTHFTEYTEDELEAELVAAGLAFVSKPRICYGELYAVIAPKMVNQSSVA